MQTDPTSTRRVATVFGGSGFIGRYVVKRLADAGYVVRVAGRDPAGTQFLRPMGRVGQVVPLYASFAEPATIARGVEGAAVVVNLVGILAEQRPGDFARVQTDAAGLIAGSARQAGVERLVHVSAIGADPASRSQYGASKGRGEQAVLAGFADASILRPSIVFGAEDKFFNRFAAMARFAPVMPVICGATLFQPVYVGDVADAVHAVVARPEAGGLYALGGPDVTSFRDLLAYILRVVGRRRPLVPVPYGVAMLQAAVAERLPGRPFTRDQLLMLGADNVVAPGQAGLAALGITPTPYDMVVPGYLARYRAGGGG